MPDAGQHCGSMLRGSCSTTTRTRTPLTPTARVSIGHTTSTVRVPHDRNGPCSALGEAFRKGASRSGPSRRLEGTQELLPNRLHRRQAKSISGQTMGRCQTLAVLGINPCLNETEVDNTQGGSRKLLALQGELQKCRPDLVELSQSDMRLSVSRRI